VIAIVDYGAGNLTSVYRAIRHIGHECVITSDPAQLKRADKTIIPGVGHFKATRTLSADPLSSALREFITADKPLLGICLGLQWMFEGSDEAPELSGLGVFDGRCSRFSDRVKTPHVGWNQIAVDPQSRLLQDVPSNSYVYYTHSYRAPACSRTVAVCTYEAPFTAAAESGNLFGVQFHPEKSGDVGLGILENFCGL
jgi:imidazole glycerol-phosphate synthase subunit HisH